MNKFHQIEIFYSRDFREFLYELYWERKMSCQEIAETIYKESGIKYTSRSVHLFLSKRGVTRDQAAAMKNRVLTGRMDYSKRMNDPAFRRTDYDNISERKGNLWASGLGKFLPDDESKRRLARVLAIKIDRLNRWIYLKHRITPEYQNLIQQYFNVDKGEVFTNVMPLGLSRTVEKPKKKTTAATLIKRKYLYASHLKQELYKAEKTLRDLADYLGCNENHISQWIAGTMVSPRNQERIINFLQIPLEKVFTKKRRGELSSKYKNKIQTLRNQKENQ